MCGAVFLFWEKNPTQTRRNLEAASKNKYMESNEAIGLVHLWK